MQERQQLYSSYLVNCILNAFLCFIATMLNIVTIQAIRKTPSFPKTLKTMLLSLAVSDLGVGFLVQPSYTALRVMDLKQVSNNEATYDITYNAYLTSAYLFGFASFFGVMALIADRFLVIHYYLSYQELVTQKRVVVVVILFWLFSTIITSIRWWIPQNIFYAIVGFIMLACFIITTFFSVKICFAVRRHMNEIQVLQVNQVAQNGEMVNILRLRKFAIAAVNVYLVFLICYLPYTCFRFAAPFMSGSSIDISRLYLYFTALVFLNSSLNPLVYCWKMKHMRQTFINILRNPFSNHD